MKLTLFLCALVLLLCGCSNKDWHTFTDAKIERAVFMECLEKLPKGPEFTKYNDWDEVVSECRKAAQEIATTMVLATAEEIDALRRNNIGIKQ